MENLKALSNDVLLGKTFALVSEERKITTSVLWYLHEIQRRRLYSEKGFGSLFEYAVKELGYSEAAAGRRIAAMRLLAEIPEVEHELEKGNVTLSTLCTLQNFFQRKESPTTKEEKVELVLALQGKSRRECEKQLATLAPEAIVPKERERVVSPTQTEIRFVADDSLMEKLQKVRQLDGHVNTDASYLELFHRMADMALKKLDPLATMKIGKPIESERKSTPPAERTSHQNPRFIPAAMRRAVWARDRSCCCYKSRDGRRCSSRFALEIDHITPLALGGMTELSNLQLLCRTHNRHKAISQLSEGVMRPYVRV